MTTHSIDWTLDPADPVNFVGEAFATLMAAGEGDASVKLYYVRFEPGARTNWHAHTGTQILVVRKGRCRYQRDGEAVREAGAGECIRFEPDVRHWHGAVPGEVAEHVAINLENPATNWMDAVEDSAYLGR